MIQLIKTSHGLSQIIIKDCLTEKRGDEFKKIHEDENSFPLLITFNLVKTNSTNLTTEELEKRQRERKVKKAC